VPSYTVGYIDVYRNGVRLVSTDFTATTGTTVVLANACTSGDAVVTESFLVSSVLNAIPATAGAVAGSYLAALSTITTSTGGTITIPTPTGTMMVSGNMPAFSAYSNANQTTTTNVWTKIAYQVEEYDTNSNFDSTTNYRFTPTVAGYYQINGSYYSNGGPTRCAIAIYKNGSSYKFADTVATTYAMFISSLVYLNGSTDYVEIYMNNVTGGSGVLADSTRTYFSGSMTRSA
jgi:hypothetical protein